MSLEKPCTFLLVKEKTWKRIFNTNSELSEKWENRIFIYEYGCPENCPRKLGPPPPPPGKMPPEKLFY